MTIKLNTLPLNHDPVRTKLILDHVPTIKRITSQIAVRLPRHIDSTDLFSAGMIGLMDAIEKYDPARDSKFKTYAEFRIRGAIFDELRNQDWLPRSVREIHKKNNRAQIMLEHQLGRKPSEQETSDFLQLNLDDYQQQLSRMNVTLVSLDEILTSTLTQVENQSALDTLESVWTQSPTCSLSTQDIQNKIVKTLEELPQKQRLVLKLYYYNDLNLKEIAGFLSLTESRISQLHTAGISGLKKKLKDILTE